MPRAVWETCRLSGYRRVHKLTNFTASLLCARTILQRGRVPLYGHHVDMAPSAVRDVISLVV